LQTNLLQQFFNTARQSAEVLFMFFREPLDPVFDLCSEASIADFLLIDEIKRATPAKVFGSFFTFLVLGDSP
jgi:hypothetical protein